MVILKRSAFIVFGKKHITYYRLPPETELLAHRIRWNKEDVILDSPKAKLKNYSDGGLPPVDYDYEGHCAWEAAPCRRICFFNFTRF